MPKLFTLSASLRAILKNASWMIAEQVVRMLAALFVGVWIARRLGPTDFGVLSFTQAFVGLFAVVASLGLNRLLVRELVSHRDTPNDQAVIVVTAFVFRAIAALALYSLAVCVTLLREDATALIVAVVGTSILAAPFDCTDQYFQSQSRSRIVVLARSSAFFISTIVKIVLLLMGAGLWEIVYAIALEYILNAIALAFVYRRFGLSTKLAPDWRLGLRLVRESWPEIISSFAVLFFIRSGQLLLESMRGPAEVGIYSAAARLAEAWYFIPIMITASAFPKIVATREHDRARYMYQISKLTVALIGISYAAIVVATLAAKPVVLALYGAAYAASASVLAVQIWCGLFVSLAQISGAWIMAERKVILNMQRSVMGAACNVILCLLLIPRLGAAGAAWATLVAMFIAYYFSDVLRPATREMFYLKTKALLLLTHRTSRD